MSDDLEKKFKEFCSKQKSALNNTIVRNGTAINIGVAVSKSLITFATTKSPFALVEGVFSTFKAMEDALVDPNEFFSDTNGWVKLNPFYALFSPVIETFDKKFLTFPYTKAYIASINGIEIGFFKDRYNENVVNFFYKEKQIAENELKILLSNEMIKFLNSNFISLISTKGAYGNKTSIAAEKLYDIKSKTADRYVDYVKHCVSLNINRSCIFYGPPGVGKTTLTHTIVSGLNYKTLKFRYEGQFTNFSAINNIIDLFKIEAVLIDDFDQVSAPNSLLEFLETLNKKVKIVFAIANSIKDFHPAIKRPRRFDEIILIESLDEEIIKLTLGDLYKEFGERTKKWPIAFINELVSRKKIDRQDMNEAYKELNERVLAQTEKKEKDDDEEEAESLIKTIAGLTDEDDLN